MKKSYLCCHKFGETELVFVVRVPKLGVMNNIDLCYSEIRNHGYELHPDWQFGHNIDNEWPECFTFMTSQSPKGEGRVGSKFYSIQAKSI